MKSPLAISLYLGAPIQHPFMVHCEIDEIRVINLKFNPNTHCSTDGSCEPNGGS